LAVLLLIFLLVGYLLFSLPPDIKSQIVTSQPSAEAAKSFNTKVTTFRTAILWIASSGQAKNRCEPYAYRAGGSIQK